MQIENNLILISGGSSGLGAACAAHFLKLGGKVLLLDIAPPKSSELIDNPQCLYQRADVTQELDVQHAIEAGQNQLGSALSGAVTCAGVLHSERSVGRDGAGSLSAFRRVIEINLVGTFNVVRLSAEAMAKCTTVHPDGEKGVIVMTASIAAFDGQTGQSAYAASKGGVAAMTLPLARDLGRSGIRVVSIAPGVFETPMMEVAPGAVRDSLLGQTVFPTRFGQPHEFAMTVQHVMENSMFNGCTIRLDAGLRMPIK
jgi:NAD(P)-dependent dehydrogenase (short-subunit alcohol dehydrogenase family)